MAHHDDDLLCEIGTEELPARFLKSISKRFFISLEEELKQSGFIPLGEIKYFATPRRIAILFEHINAIQPEQVIQRRGPSFEKAFDENQNPTAACVGFAHSNHVQVKDLEILETEKGKWVVYSFKKTGETLIHLFPSLLERALKKLSLPKVMRFGEKNSEFIRPVRWLTVMFGKEIIFAECFGIKSKGETFGHRLKGKLKLNCAQDYESILKTQGWVIPDFNERQQHIYHQISQLAKSVSSKLLEDKELLEEVTAIVEYPVAFLAKIDQKFLELPKEVLITVMKHHQKSFSVLNQNDEILPYFIGVANIKSERPEQMLEGYERVMNARLNDALFFYHQDKKIPLSSRVELLKNIECGQGTGSMFDKATRIAKFSLLLLKAGLVKTEISLSENHVENHFENDEIHALALLTKADLVTGMVGEFPELQGIMGYYYALLEGLPESQAIALREQYLPRFAKDNLPSHSYGIIFSLADKFDHLLSYFRAGQYPSSDKDPYGLRRAALGVVRILITDETALPINFFIKSFQSIFNESVIDHSVDPLQVEKKLCDFLLERLKAKYLEEGGASEIWMAVLSIIDTKKIILSEIIQRLEAVKNFMGFPQAPALMSAHKRVTHVLESYKKDVGQLDVSLLIEDAEKKLFETLQSKEKEWNDFQLSDIDWLRSLATLQPDIDYFFEKVMVMTENQSLQMNRLALLKRFSVLFQKVADISFLYGLK